MSHAHDTEEVQNTYTRGIAEFVADAEVRLSIPDQVRERIKLLILDSFGCAIFGAELPWSKILLETLSAAEDSSTTTPRMGHRQAPVLAARRAGQRHAGAGL